MKKNLVRAYVGNSIVMDPSKLPLVDLDEMAKIIAEHNELNEAYMKRQKVKPQEESVLSKSAKDYFEAKSKMEIALSKWIDETLRDSKRRGYI